MCEMDTESPVVWPSWCYSGAISIEAGVQRKLKMQRSPDIGAGEPPASYSPASHPVHAVHPAHTNNNIKDERLSPETSEASSGSLTPSSASYPGTPPAPDHHAPASGIGYAPGRNYSDFIRNLAAKYNKNSRTDYYDALRQNYTYDGRPMPKTSPTYPAASKDDLTKPEFPSLLNFSSSPFSQLIDMSATQTLCAMIQSAKEEEVQGLMKTGNGKRAHRDAASPLDLSATTCSVKKSKKRRDERERCRESDDVSSWGVEDVCSFVGSIDICAEYVEKFREQRIDGAGLPLLTEEHLTTKMNMKLGPALKLRSLLTRRAGTCSVCLHCSHCHSAASPETTDSTPEPTDAAPKAAV